MQGIGKAFGSVRVLEDVQFDLNAGEVHILAGENGAGKSTLIKILAGVHTEHEGTIELNGQQTEMTSPQDAAAKGVAVIHQELSLIPAMSVVDNMFLGRERTAKGGWLKKSEQRAHARKMLEQLGLDVHVDAPVEDYPLSVQQMIEISKALAFEAKIIVMDEPTSALTKPEVEKLFSIIGDLKAKGCGIIYISHKMDEIYRIADRLTVLRDGKYIGTDTEEALPEPKLVQWMVGRELSDQFPKHDCQAGEPIFTVEHFSMPDPGGAPRLAVNDVSFTLRKGEVLGIAGLEGSGNSAMLNGIFGTYGKLPSAKVTLDGAPFAIGSPSRSIGEGVALLTNDRKGNGLVLNMSITHNTTLASLKQFSPGGWMRPNAERDAAQAHVKKLNTKTATLEQAVSTLSGGNQQKVVIGKWLQTNPRVLMLDDPTRGVDVGAKHEIYELINQLVTDGMSIILVSSEMPELLALCDRILVMHFGQLTAEFEHGEATQEKILQAAIGATHAAAV